MKSESSESCKSIIDGKRHYLVCAVQPAVEGQFKVYIYCNKKGRLLYENFPNGADSRIIGLASYRYVGQSHALNGKVIGECTCVNAVTLSSVAQLPEAVRKEVGKLVRKRKQKAFCLMTIKDFKLYDAPLPIDKFKRSIVSYYDPTWHRDEVLSTPPTGYSYVKEVYLSGD
ncbi:MAG: hypothetical protein NC218_01750 [Acetobacter sp.]|nr:hypothetical protein [Acetobacter sp.]